MASRSIRSPGAAEILRKNPFRNYTDGVQLGSTPDESTVEKFRDRDIGTVKFKPSSSSASKSRVYPPPSSSSSSSAPKKAERVASPLHEIYPDGVSGPEYSLIEIIASRRALRDIRTGKLCDTLEQDCPEWEKEMKGKGASWRLDGNGEVLLRDERTGEALFECIRKRDVREREERLEAARIQKELADVRKAEEARARQMAEETRAKQEAKEARARQLAEEARARQMAEETRARELAEGTRARQEAKEARARQLAEEARARQGAEDAAAKKEHDERRERPQQQEEEKERRMQITLEEERRELKQSHEVQQERKAPEVEVHDQRAQNAGITSDRQGETRRPPSPTINTKAALAEVNAMFSKTMRFDDDAGTQEDDGSDTEHSASSDDEGFENATPLPPSQAETDDTFWSHSQGQSQQPSSSQQLVPSQSSSGSGFDSESGETTEESEEEGQAFRRLQPQKLLQPVSQQPSHSRSSSSSSVYSASGPDVNQDCQPSSYKVEESPAILPRPGKTAFLSKKPDGSGIADENSSISRPAFKPTRHPLSAKGLLAASIPERKPAFEVFCEKEVPAASSNTAAPTDHLPVFSDDLESEASRQDGFDDEAEVGSVAGYAMGRRVNGNNRFASMMDVMTPITERTCEFGVASIAKPDASSGEVRAMPGYAVSDSEDEDEEHCGNDLARSRNGSRDANRIALGQIEEEAELLIRGDAAHHGGK